jgi:hypothetical protein
MLKIRENAIYCVNGKCAYSVKNNLDHHQNSLYNYDEFYGNQNNQFSKFEHLAIPLFTLQEQQPIEETIITESDFVVDDGLFDSLLQKVEVESKKKSPKTKKKRDKKETKKKSN